VGGIRSWQRGLFHKGAPNMTAATIPEGGHVRKLAILGTAAMDALPVGDVSLQWAKLMPFGRRPRRASTPESNYSA
jgi:hypothetical protein